MVYRSGFFLFLLIFFIEYSRNETTFLCLNRRSITRQFQNSRLSEWKRYDRSSLLPWMCEVVFILSSLYLFLVEEVDGETLWLMSTLESAKIFFPKYMGEVLSSLLIRSVLQVACPSSRCWWLICRRSQSINHLFMTLLLNIDRGDLSKFNNHCRNRQILMDTLFFDLTTNYNLW